MNSSSNDLKINFSGYFWVVTLMFLLPGIVEAQNLKSLDDIFVNPVISDNAEEYRAVASEFYVVTPAKLEFKEELIDRLNVPEGFSVSVFAEDLENARIIAVSDEGHVYVSQRDQGNVLLLQDKDGDGRADRKQKVATDMPDVHGLAIHENWLYLVTNKELYRAEMNDDGSLDTPEQLRDDLPDGGQHPNRTIGFGPDGKLYLSVGSTCNACDEPRDEHATLLRMDIDGSNQEIFAEGLRNTIGFEWHPETNDLWGFDHNSDGRGNDVPPEQLNHIQEGKHYGWPWVYGKQEVDYHTNAPPPGNMGRKEFAETTEPMVLGYQAHSAPMQMAFYTRNSFPSEFHHDAFVAMRGSWNRFPAVGYEVVRIKFENGQPKSLEPFITGWLTDDGRSHFGRLVGMAEHPEGFLLLCDDQNGIMYRIAYER